jgi:hypothetical protein
MATHATALEVYSDHLPTLQPLARPQLRHDRTDERMPEMLNEIAVRGETPEWRDWASYQITKLSRRRLPDGYGGRYCRQAYNSKSRVNGHL